MRLILSLFLVLIVGAHCEAQTPQAKPFDLEAKKLRKADPTKALEYYEKILKDNPNDLFTLYDKVSLLNELERYDEALVTIEQVLRVDPTESQGYLEKARIYKKLKKEEQSKQTLEEGLGVIEKKTQSETLHCPDLFARPMILFDLGRLQEAENEIAKLERLAENPTAGKSRNDCDPARVAYRARTIIESKKEHQETIKNMKNKLKDNKRMEPR